MICICCPKGCHLVYDEKSGNVSGNSCAMGARYAAAEAVDPKRVVTSTVRINSSTAVMLPVKTNFAIPKHMVMKAVELLNDIEVQPPVFIGDVVYKNILGTGADFVCTKTVNE